MPFSGLRGWLCALSAHPGTSTFVFAAAAAGLILAMAKIETLAVATLLVALFSLLEPLTRVTQSQGRALIR
jgi:hypothetical protein